MQNIASKRLYVSGLVLVQEKKDFMQYDSGKRPPPVR